MTERSGISVTPDLRLRMGVFMKRIKLSSNFAIFALFFGVATLEAFQTRNWLKAAFWLTIGVVFLVADNMKREGKQEVFRRNS